MLFRTVLFFIAFSFSTNLFATAQFPDKLIYQGEEYGLHVNPLDGYFVKHPEKMAHLKLRHSTALWRGHIALFEIKNKELLLKDIRVPNEEKTFGGHWEEWTSILPKLFSDQGAQKMDWYSGTLVVPMGDRVEGVHMGYESIFQNYILIEIKNGIFVNETRVTGDEYRKFRDRQREVHKKAIEHKAP